jgi:hypothetical protein
MAAGKNPENRREMGRRALPWALAVVIVLAVVLRVNSLSFVRGLAVADEIVDTSEVYRQQIRDNQALEEQIKFLQTDEGRRQACWQKLGHVSPGQQVGRLVETPPPPPPTPDRAQRVRKFIKQQEQAGTEAIHRLGEMVRCYTRRRPLDQPPASDGNSPAAALSKTPKDDEGSG